MKRFYWIFLALYLVFVPHHTAKAPVPIYLGIALKCIAVGVIGPTAIIIYKCDQDYYLARYQMDGEEPSWDCSKANPRTLKKCGGRRCEGPWKSPEEPTFRAWANNKGDPNSPMFPCGPLGAGTIPAATRTNYSIVSPQVSINGGKTWKSAGSVLLEPGESNWSICLLGPTGTNGMTVSELKQVADCDLVVPNGIPAPYEIKEFAVRGFEAEVPPGFVRSMKPITANQ